MPNKTPPAFQFYAADFLADINVIVMTAEEVGAYLLLMLVCWREGHLPIDKQLLSQISRVAFDRFSIMWENRLEKCFSEDEEGYFHRRLRAEREKQISLSEARSAAGKSGGRPPKSQKQLLNFDKAKKSSSSSSSDMNITPISPQQTGAESQPKRHAAESPHPLMALWNSERDVDAGWPACAGWTPRRAAAAKVRLKEIPDLDDWRLAIATLRDQDWIGRPGEHEGWRPGIDWLLSPGNAMKYLELGRANGVAADGMTPEDRRLVEEHRAFKARQAQEATA